MKRVLMIFVLILFLISGVSAIDYYVRPEGGDYGLEDGTSYGNAWDGLLNVVWGNQIGEVGPGDTLYVSGLHLHVKTEMGSGIVSLADITPISGISENERVVIRGDYPGDPGIIWGGYISKLSRDGLEWVQQSAPNNNVWRYNLWGGHYPDLFFQDVSASGFTLLDLVDSIEDCQSNPGSAYYDTVNDYLYVHTTDSGNATDRIVVNRYGYDFKMNRKEYITFKNLHFYSLYTHPFISSYSGVESMSHIRFEGCSLIYGEHYLIEMGDNSHYNEVINCELAWAGNAIYTLSTTNNSSSNYLFKGNYIHDIGIREISQNSDAHAIGIQGGHDGIIEDNIIENCGTGPGIYAFTNQELKNTIIRRNIIKNLHTLGSATGYGIFTMCNNDAMADKSGNKFYNNIVINSPVCYRFQFEDEQEVYNNIAYNCDIGLQTSRNYNGLGANIKIRNNIFYNDEGSFNYHIDWYSGATNFTLNFDNNLYYPTEGNVFYKSWEGNAINFSEWQAISVPGSVFDPNSLSVEPLFIDAINNDFHLQPNSPAIDNGTNLGALYNIDFDGIIRPQGLGWDIGAYEYIQSGPSACGDADTSGNDVIEIGELINYISSWKSGSVMIGELITAIGKWKSGC